MQFKQTISFKTVGQQTLGKFNKKKWERMDINKPEKENLKKRVRISEKKASGELERMTDEET